MRLAAHVAAAYAVMLLAGPIWPILPFQVVAPNLAVIFAAYLGITARERVSDPTLAAVVIGWIADLLTGTPRGLTSAIAGLTCLLARFTTARLLVRGGAFVAGFNAAAAMLSWIVTLALAAAFGMPTHLDAWWGQLVAALGSAALTGLCAPPMFRMLRGLDARFARTEREREAVREGYLN